MRTIKPDLVVESAICTSPRDPSVGVYGHTVEIIGLDYRREHFDNDEAFRQCLEEFRGHIIAGLDCLHGERYTVGFDFEAEQPCLTVKD